MEIAWNKACRSFPGEGGGAVAVTRGWQLLGVTFPVGCGTSAVTMILLLGVPAPHGPPCLPQSQLSPPGPAQPPPAPLLAVCPQRELCLCKSSHK